MTFDELVIFYITLIGCTAKELTIESGLANGTISRYMHAQRKPTSNSTTVPMIADGMVSLAKKRISLSTVMRLLSLCLSPAKQMSPLRIRFTAKICVSL